MPSTTPWATTSRPPGKQAMATVRNRARRAPEARAPAAVELDEELGHVVVVGGVLPRVPRREHAGGAPERVDLEPGVVGDGGEPGGLDQRHAP